MSLCVFCTEKFFVPSKNIDLFLAFDAFYFIALKLFAPYLPRKKCRVKQLCLARLKRHLRICLDVGVFFMTYYCWVLVFVTASLLFKSWWQLFFHLALSSFLALILETCLRRQQCRIVSTFFSWLSQLSDTTFLYQQCERKYCQCDKSKSIKD